MSTGESTDARTGPVSLADEEAVKQVLASAVLGLWDVVNNLTRLKPSQRERFRVTIFGSARVRPGTFGYEETQRTAAALAEMGCDIITGGGPGLMQAANEGAASAGGSARSVGIRVDLPFEQGVNAFVTEAFEHRTFFTRLHQFVLASDAFVVAPGGIGTVLETMLIWQLLQVQAPPGDAAHPRRKDVARAARVGAWCHARHRSAAGGRRRHRDPALRGKRRRGDRAAPRMPRGMARQEAARVVVAPRPRRRRGGRALKPIARGLQPPR